MTDIERIMTIFRQYYNLYNNKTDYARAHRLPVPQDKGNVGAGNEIATISYLESSFLIAHSDLTKRATLERSTRGAVLIGCSRTMQMADLNQRSI